VEEYSQRRLVERHGDLPVTVSDIPYAVKFGGATAADMTLGEYIEEVKAHRILGGRHPWYVFRGHPIPALSESEASLVKYDICPTPEVTLLLFKITP
jgi:hypothetical protein